MQATTPARTDESTDSVLNDNCTVLSTTYNARVISIIKYPRAAFALSYPGIMFIYQINKSVLLKNDQSQIDGYTPNILHLEPKIHYTLPNLGDDSPSVLIECLNADCRNDRFSMTFAYTIKKISMLREEKIKIAVSPEERFLIGDPESTLIIKDNCQTHVHEKIAQIIPQKLNGHISINSHKKMPRVWIIPPQHEYLLLNPPKKNQDFYLVTINKKSSKL